jgi:phosphoribosylamine--glycine ligase
MGAYSPASIFTPELERRVLEEIVHPTVRALAEAGTPFSGVLFAGLMLTEAGPKLIEYNVRFGDPECQALMMRFEADLLALMLATAKGELAACLPPAFSEEAALCVVVAANGYPGTPEKGGTISGLEKAERKGAKVFHAGTALKDGRLVADGGRVLGVTARGANLVEAQRAAYRAVDAIDFPSGFARRDIGWREIARLKG